MNEKEKAAAAWHALTAILALKKEVGVVDVTTHLMLTPKPHIAAAQFILRGSGCATEELVPDGVYGEQSYLSIAALYNAAR